MRQPVRLFVQQAVEEIEGARLPPDAVEFRHGLVHKLTERWTAIDERRQAALVDRSPAFREFVDKTVAEFNGVRGQPRSFDLLDRLLNEQSYRLAHWRVASEEINYRRFFDVNELAALRMEDPAVFDEVHRFVFELIRCGAASGLRVDHVDGLNAPAEYLCRLQKRAAEAHAGREAQTPPAAPASF